MQILARPGERELQTREPATRNSERRLVDPPHGAVRRENDVGVEELLVIADEAVKTRTADLLLALDQKLDVQRERAIHGEERLRDLDRDEHWSFVIRYAAGVESSIAER